MSLLRTYIILSYLYHNTVDCVAGDVIFSTGMHRVSIGGVYNFSYLFARYYSYIWVSSIGSFEAYSTSYDHAVNSLCSTYVFFHDGRWPCALTVLRAHSGVYVITGGTCPYKLV